MSKLEPITSCHSVKTGECICPKTKEQVLFVPKACPATLQGANRFCDAEIWTKTPSDGESV